MLEVLSWDERCVVVKQGQARLDYLDKLLSRSFSQNEGFQFQFSSFLSFLRVISTKQSEHGVGRCLSSLDISPAYESSSATEILHDTMNPQVHIELQRRKPSMDNRDLSLAQE